MKNRNRVLFFLLAAAAFFSCQTPSHLNRLISREQYEKAKSVYAAINNPAVKDSKGNSPLHTAAEKGNADLCEYFIQAGVPADEKNNAGETPLFLALKNGNGAAAATLLKHGANILSADNNGVSAQSHFLANDAMIDEILAEKVRIYPLPPHGSENGIHDFLYFEEAIRIHNPNLRFDEARTPLHIAADRGHNDILRYLLRKESEIDAVDVEGTTPLHFALQKGNVDTSLILIDAGASANARDKSGRNSLYYVIIPLNPRGRSAIFSETLSAAKTDLGALLKEGGLCKFVSENKIALDQADMYEILLTKGASVNIKDKDSESPVHYVVKNKLPIEILKSVVSAGANLDERNNFGETALAIAVSNQMADCAKFLVDSGSDIFSEDLVGYTPVVGALASDTPGLIEAVVNEKTVVSRSRRGETPLHIAVTVKSPRVVLEYLRQNGLSFYLAAQDLKGNTPLHAAILSRNVEAERLLIEWGADAFSENFAGQSALRLAFDDGGETMDAMICPAVISDRDSNENTALHFACAWNNEAAARKLIERGAALDAKNFNGESPLFMAVKANAGGIATLLSESGADLRARDKLGNSPLHAGVAANSFECAGRLLDLGADLETQNLSGKTPLAEAAAKGRRKFLDLFIRKGADVNAADSRGITILMDSIKSNSIDNAKLLLENGASADSQSIDGRTALHDAVLSGNASLVKLIRSATQNPDCFDNQGRSPLSLAFSSQNAAVIDAVLPADLNSADSFGNTPIHIAVSEGAESEIFKKAIAKGYPLDRRNKNGETALHLAVMRGDYERSAVLLEFGADPFIKSDSDECAVTIAMKRNDGIFDKIAETAIGRTDLQEETLLHYAAAHGTRETVRKLIALGYSRDAKNISGETPTDVARRWGHEAFFSDGE